MAFPTQRFSLLILSGLILVACDQAPAAPEDEEAGRLPDPGLAALSNTWVDRANLPRVERTALTTAVVTNAAGQSVLYAIGGRSTASGGSLSNVQAYNVASNSWSDRAPLPRPLYWTNGAGVINGRIYVSGGITSNKNYRAELYEYDPETNTWRERAPMPTQGFRGVTGVIDNRLYVVTNCDQEDCFDFVSRALYRYNPVTDRWVVLRAPSHYHAWGFGGVIGGKFYVTGGSNALEVYDPETNRWTEKAPLPRRRWLGAGAALGGRLYVIGGFRGEADGTSETIVATTSVYDPASDTWSNGAPFPEPFLGLSASRVLLGGKPRIHVVGGTRPGNNRAYIP